MHVEHYERIELVDVVPRPDLTVISGNNTQGKSSFLHFLAGLFEGKGSRSTVPLKTGHATGGGFVVLTADGKPEFTIELELREGKADRVVVRDDKGNPTAKSQEWLKSLVGRGLAFDPAEFDDPPGCRTKEARDKVRLDMMLRLFPIGVDLVALKTKREDFYARRTIANRDRDTVAAELSLIVKGDVAAPVDLAAKRAELARERSRGEDRRHHVTAIGGIDKRIEELRVEFEKLKATRAEHVAAHAGLGEAVDVSGLEAEVTTGERTNIERERVLAGNAAYDKLLGKLGAAKRLSDEMTASIEAIDAEKAKALEDAKFPVPGLFVSETEVRFKGLPYEQASDAERLEIAFSVCAADKPQLALALIDVGERFDEAAVERVRAICERMDIQCVMARRSTEPGIARVELVDGRNAT